MNLSTKAIQNLRVALRTSYGSDFELSLSDEDLQEIGKALLVITAEHLKIKSRVS